MSDLVLMDKVLAKYSQWKNPENRFRRIISAFSFRGDYPFYARVVALAIYTIFGTGQNCPLQLPSSSLEQFNKTITTDN